MFTVFLDKHSIILQRLLDFFVGRGKKVIDFTYGTGALWKNVEGYEVTKCDAQGDETTVYKRSLEECHFGDLGQHDAGVFDPPYLMGRDSFDYSAKVEKGHLVPMQMQGKRSWGHKGVANYTSNRTEQDFINRVAALNSKAPDTLKKNAYLFVKILDPRHQGRLITHHITIANKLANFTLDEIGVYIRQGATTWTMKNHLQNLHGYWMVFKRK